MWLGRAAAALCWTTALGGDEGARPMREQKGLKRDCILHMLHASRRYQAARGAQSARNERRVRPSYRPAYHVSPGFGDRCSRACASALHGCAAGERPPQPPQKGSTDWRGAGSREGITHQGHRSYTASPSRDESAALGRGPGARPPEGVMGGARHGVGTRLRAGGGTKSLPREFGETLIWSPDTTLSL